MRIFTVKLVSTGQIRWEGAEFTNGMVCMVPASPDVGLPTVFIDHRSLIESFWDQPEVFIAWADVEVPT
jgi:hypothetical protein